MSCKKFFSGFFSFLSNEKRICKLLNITPKSDKKEKKEEDEKNQALIVDSLISIDTHSLVYTPPTALTFKFNAKIRVAISTLFGVMFTNIQNNNGVSEPGINATTVVNPLIFNEGEGIYNIKCTETKLASNICLIIISAMEPRTSFQVSTEIFTVDLNTNLNEDGELLLKNPETYIPGLDLSPLSLHANAKEKEDFEKLLAKKIIDVCKQQNLKTPDNFLNLITIEPEDPKKSNSSSNSYSNSTLIDLFGSNSNRRAESNQLSVPSYNLSSIAPSSNEKKKMKSKQINQNSNQPGTPSKENKDLIVLSESSSNNTTNINNKTNAKNNLKKVNTNVKPNSKIDFQTGNGQKDKKIQQPININGNGINRCDAIIVLPRRIEIVEHKIQIGGSFFFVRKIYGVDEEKSAKKTSEPTTTELNPVPTVTVSDQITSCTLSIFSNLSTGNATRTGQTCSICLGGEASVICYPCRHLAFCPTCANDYRARSTICPVCRSKIEILIALFPDLMEKNINSTTVNNNINTAIVNTNV